MTKKTEGLTREEAQEVLGAAANRQHAEDEKLKVSEVIAAGEEVGIPAKQTRAAIKAREEETARAAKARQIAADQAAKRSKEVRAAVKFGVLLALFITLCVGMLTFGTATIRQNEIRAAHEELRYRRAQVRLALRRQAEVTARYSQPQIPSTVMVTDDGTLVDITGNSAAERTAEIAGAGNRVYVAIGRYDTAAAQYNAVVARPGGESAARALHCSLHAPLSSEVTSW